MSHPTANYSPKHHHNLLVDYITLRDKLALFSYDIDSPEAISAFEDYLDSTYATVDILGTHYDMSYVLKEVDPVAYHDRLCEWAENMDYSEMDEYKELEKDMMLARGKVEEYEAIFPGQIARA